MNKIPEVKSNLKYNKIRIPEEIDEASGIIINGKKIKSCLFSTDIAVINNTNADSILAIYPFTPQQSIAEAIIKYSSLPVFCGVGGGTTCGKRAVEMAMAAEASGAFGVVLNSPIPNTDLTDVVASIDIPTIITITSLNTDFCARIASGAKIFNVAGASETVNIIKRIRAEYPNVPIIASGGSTSETIKRTIEAGANAISYTPPNTKDIFSEMMTRYRKY